MIPVRQRAFCAERCGRRTSIATNTLKDDVAGVPADGCGGSFKDDRFKAFYIMGSGPGQGFRRRAR